jgi:nucleoside-diphosphate-sugar epimerase
MNVVIGAGPVGRSTAAELVARGQHVTVVSRSGTEVPGTTAVRADAGDPASLRRAIKSASVLYNCVNPPYHQWQTLWPQIANSILGVAEQLNAGLVTMSNLYAYGFPTKPFHESDALAATTRKGIVRAEMWKTALAAHQAGRVRVTEARASDFIGPDVVDAGMGERVVPPLLKGKPAMLLGRTDVPHAFTYMGDVGKLMATLGTDDRSWGKAWNVPTAPARTQRQIIDGLCEAAEVKPVAIRVMSPRMIKVAGLFSPLIRELPEMLYQFNESFDLDSSAATATFGLEPTPHEAVFATTVQWYSQRAKKR